MYINAEHNDLKNSIKMVQFREITLFVYLKYIRTGTHIPNIYFTIFPFLAHCAYLCNCASFLSLFLKVYSVYSLVLDRFSEIRFLFLAFRYFIFYCKIFGILEDFSKWSILPLLASSTFKNHQMNLVNNE